MKPVRLLLAAGLLLSSGSLFAAASKAETYTVVGYFKGAKPTDALFQKATEAVAQKVAGMKQVAATEDPDHRIEVLFTRDTFIVYVDALPLARESFKMHDPAPSGDSMERAESDRSSPR